MKIAYTFTIIRYVHDVVAGEFVNVGVILYAPTASFLGSSCTRSSQRLSQFFGRVEGDYIKAFLRRIERGVYALSMDLFGSLPLNVLPDDVLACAESILPRDDSALQFSPMAGGLTVDPAATLAQIFDRYVEKYRKVSTSTTRHDNDILPLFKRPLEERALLPRLQPKIISTPDYEHEFPLAWKNGKWNACDAVSFDLAGSSDILEKANKWVGRTHILKESRESFRLILLLGEPHHKSLIEAARKAENILRKSPGDVLLIREGEAEKLAEIVASDFRGHAG